jgi:hypothetical protein
MAKRTSHFLLVVLIICFYTFIYSIERPVLRYTFPPDGYHLQRVKRQNTAQGIPEFIIDETTYQQSDPVLSDLTLSFNSKQMSAADDSKMYRIQYTSFKFYDKSDASGSGAAYFYKSEDYIKLLSAENTWSTNSDDLGSFTIEFRLQPSSFKDNAIIYQRVGYSDGIKNGIEITLQDRKIQTSFYNLFYDERGKRSSISFLTPQTLKANQWYYFSLSFNRTNGLLSVVLDDVEQYSRYLTSDMTRSGTVLIPAFTKNDVPEIIIGKEYTGLLDEFRISYTSFNDLTEITSTVDKKYIDVKANNRLPANSEGVVTSSIYEFPHTGTMIKKFSWNQTLQKNSFIWFEIRLSDNRFDQFHKNPRWYRITNNQLNIYLHKQENNGLYLRGKYLQWRAHLISSPDGKYSPVLGPVKIEFEIDNPPVPPLGLEVIETGDKYVILRWKKNVDHDIAGYYIYYGIKNREYDGKIYQINSSKIVNTDEDFVQTKLENYIIEENRKIDDSSILTYPLLKNNVLYFFSVTAYDTYRQGTKYNHESDFSVEVNARPFAGSEIIAQ